MDEMLKGLLGGELEQMGTKLQGLDGFSPEKAKSFLSAIVDKVTGLFSSGSLDLNSLMGDVDLADLSQKLDPADLATKAGISQEQAQAGLDSALPDLVGKAKAALGGGLGDLLGGI